MPTLRERLAQRAAVEYLADVAAQLVEADARAWATVTLTGLADTLDGLKIRRAAPLTRDESLLLDALRTLAALVAALDGHDQATIRAAHRRARRMLDSLTANATDLGPTRSPGPRLLDDGSTCASDWHEGCEHTRAGQPGVPSRK